MMTPETPWTPEAAATDNRPAHPGPPGRDVLVIGVGNDLRGDDAAGLEVVRAVRSIGGERVATAEASGDGTALMDLWKEAQNIILVDAVYSGRRPGTTVRYDLREETLPALFFRTSTHAFGVAEAVALARTFESMPDRLILFGIEGKQYEAGTHLSQEVREAIPSVVRLILSDIKQVPGPAGHRGAYE